MSELDNQLSELVKKGIEIAEKTGDFAIEQAPLLLQEFYRWHIVSSIFTIIVSLLVMIAVWKGFKSLGSDEETKSSFDDRSKIMGKYYDTVGGIMMFVFGVLGIGGTAFCFMVGGIYRIIFILTAPKIYLIEYFIN